MDENHQEEFGILAAFERLPLFRTLYLNMQLQNIEVVDQFLENVEADLYREYIQTDSTPLESMIFASAISQLWIFGLYELLRTWLDWVRKLIDYRERLDAAGGDQRPHLAETQNDPAQAILNLNEQFYAESFKQVENDPSYVGDLRYARDLVRQVFRKIETVRVTLAKHEIPKTKGKRATAPGYARIDHVTQSLCWIVQLKNGTEDIISRRRIADMCRRLATKKLGVMDLFDLMKEKDVKLLEGKHYLCQLPEGISYPDTHPYIAYLKEKEPEALWDRYIPSNVVLERNARLLERITEFDSQERATLTPLEFPAETWIYNGTWEEAWENEDDEVKQKFSKPEE